MAAATAVHRKAGSRTSYRQGLREGYRQGVSAGMQQYGTLFAGTSIIIPTYNQHHLLIMCLNSIMKYTESPYEIIVVDNASTDGTAAYLESLGGEVRYRVLEANRGFAGAINTGLMMAKGRTFVLLNNDTLVTPKWLRNLLFCLESDPAIGMVGPVTNYIHGDQRIRVPYRKVEDMQAFAKKHNHRKPQLWQETEMLRGFCVLFRRELFESIGYFDEGFEFGNFEDDDYNIRTRMIGKRLVIARDTFIHHFGSVSMKALGPTLNLVNDHNQNFFTDKWNNSSEWLLRVQRHPLSQQGVLPHCAALYPEFIAVQGAGAGVYWIENGVRLPVEGALSFPAVRVSQVDLRRWPTGDAVSAEVVERRWRGLENEGLEAGVIVLRDGTPFHVEGTVARRIVSDSALKAWNLHLKPVRTVSPVTLAERIQGLPIIAPPVLKQSL